VRSSRGGECAYSNMPANSSARDRNSHSLAVLSNFATGTEGTDRLAKILAIGDKQIVERYPIPARELLPKSHLGIFRRLCRNIAKPVRNSVHVRIDSNSSLSKAERDDNVRGLPSDSR
jgi:hypothetical protein